MTVKELIEALGSHDPEALVVLSKESKGNDFHKLTPDGITLGTVEDPEKYYLKVGGVEGEEDDYDVYDHKAVVLYP